MKKIIYLLGILIIIVALILAFSLNTKKQDDVIKIGFIAPLTGSFGSWGENIKNGVELSKQDITHNLEVIYEDEGECQVEKTLNAAQKLILIDNVDIFIGPGCASGVQAIVDIVNENNAIIFSTGLLPDSILTENNNIINLATQISTEANILAEQIILDGHKKIALIRTSDAFGEEYSRVITNKLKESNVEVLVAESTSFGEKDFKTIILKGMSKNVDAFFINQGAEEIGLFAKQLKELNLDTTIYAPYVAEDPALIISGGLAVDGLIYSYPIGTKKIKEYNLFKNKYLDAYKIDPSPNALYAYDGMMLLDKALDVCKIDDGFCIKTFFIEYGAYEGISGQINFNKDGSNIRPYEIKSVQNQEFVKLQ